MVMDAVAHDVITTGSAEIDKKMGGGIPAGSLTLIEGDSDSGKSVLAQQMTFGALELGRTVSLYTSENTTRSLLRQMTSLGLDASDYYILARFKILGLPAVQAAGIDTLSEILKHAAGRQTDLIIIDSVTPYITGTDAAPSAVFAFFQACKRVCDTGKTVVVIIHDHAVDEGSMMRLRSMCDAHLRLRTEEAGDKLIKVLEVAKVRGAARATGNIISFNVEPGMGMRIIPVSKAKA